MAKGFFAVIAIALCTAFAVSPSRADSIHSKDLKADSFAAISNTFGLEGLFGSNDFFGGLESNAGLFGISASRETGPDSFDVTRNSGDPFLFPIGEHLVRVADYSRSATAPGSSSSSSSSAVPEPSTIPMAALGLLALLPLNKVSRRNRPPSAGPA
jgi:hypothetical protein